MTGITEDLVKELAGARAAARRVPRQRLCVRRGQDQRRADLPPAVARHRRQVDLRGLAMKLKFKVQPYQTQAVDSVVDCFAGQPLVSGINLPDRSRPEGADERLRGRVQERRSRADRAQVLANIKDVQQRQNLPLSDKLVASAGCRINLDVEMETGTGKTYCYIKTMFEMNKRYGWSKFIVMVPSIAIREGVHKSLADHGRPFHRELRQEGAVLHLQFQAAARAGELLVGRRHQCDGHQRPGVRRHAARTTAASTRSWTTSSPAGPSTSSPATGRS